MLGAWIARVREEERLRLLPVRPERRLVIPPLARRRTGKIYQLGAHPDPAWRPPSPAAPAAKPRAPEIPSFFGPRAAPDGLEVPLPFENADQLPVAFWALTPGPPPVGRFGTQTLSTFPLSYASFEVVGIDLAALVVCEVATDMPPQIVIESWGLVGGHDQIYRPLGLTQAGGQLAQLASPGQVGPATGGLLVWNKSLPAIREDRVGLKRNNTAQITLSLALPSNNTGDIDVQVFAALKLRVIEDDFIPGYPS